MKNNNPASKQSLGTNRGLNSQGCKLGKNHKETPLSRLDFVFLLLVMFVPIMLCIIPYPSAVCQEESECFF